MDVQTRFEMTYRLSSRGSLISHQVSLKSICKSQFPHKFVNVFFLSLIAKDKSTDLWGS